MLRSTIVIPRLATDHFVPRRGNGPRCGPYKDCGRARSLGNGAGYVRRSGATCVDGAARLRRKRACARMLLGGRRLPGCGAGSGCGAVMASRWARWGPLPAALPALAAYLTALLASLLAIWAGPPAVVRAAGVTLLALAPVFAGMVSRKDANDSDPSHCLRCAGFRGGGGVVRLAATGGGPQGVWVLHGRSRFWGWHCRAGDRRGAGTRRGVGGGSGMDDAGRDCVGSVHCGARADAAEDACSPGGERGRRQGDYKRPSPWPSPGVPGEGTRTRRPPIRPQRHGLAQNGRCPSRRRGGGDLPGTGRPAGPRAALSRHRPPRPHRNGGGTAGDHRARNEAEARPAARGGGGVETRARSKNPALVRRRAPTGVPGGPDAANRPSGVTPGWR